MNHWLEKVANFDYDMLSDPEFKEDSVREEIIMPLIKSLGYDYKGKYKLVISLIHISEPTRRRGI